MFISNAWNGLPNTLLKPGIQGHFPTFLNNFNRVVCNVSRCPWYKGFFIAEVRKHYNILLCVLRMLKTLLT